MVDDPKKNNGDEFDSFEDDEVSVPGANGNGKKKPEEDGLKSLDDEFKEGENADSQPTENEEEKLEEVGMPEVASIPKRNIFIFVGAMIGVITILFSLFNSGSDAPVETPQGAPEVAATAGANLPIESSDQEIAPPLPGVDIDQAPPAPSLPPLPEAPGAPPVPTPGGTNTGTMGVPEPLPPPIPSANNGTAAKPPLNAEEEQKRRERLKAEMIVLGVKDSGEQKPQEPPKPEDKVEKATAKKIGDTSKMIMQGKVIDSILETAINTDLPGVIRAIVSRDIYAESGRNILIPKGSRLIGAYNADVKRGQARIYIVWQRVLRPDGIDVQIESPGVDQLGRSGVAGVVDNKYLEIFGNSLLFSTLNFAFAKTAENLTGSQGVQQTQNANGSTTTSGKPSDFALQDSITQFGSVVKGIGGDLISVKPTVVIDQGERIKVFVNKDLLFDIDGQGNETARFLK